MNWMRVVGYGIALWVVPFAVSTLMFGLRTDNRALFESLIAVVAVTAVVIAALFCLRDQKSTGPGTGIVLGLVWAGVSIVLDIPIFLAVFKMPLWEYLADIALTYLTFPAVTVGMALAQRGEAR